MSKDQPLDIVWYLDADEVASIRSDDADHPERKPTKMDQILDVLLKFDKGQNQGPLRQEIQSIIDAP